jgi:hypothetical protein
VDGHGRLGRAAAAVTITEQRRRDLLVRMLRNASDLVHEVLAAGLDARTGITVLLALAPETTTKDGSAAAPSRNGSPSGNSHADPARAARHSA